MLAAAAAPSGCKGCNGKDESAADAAAPTARAESERIVLDFADALPSCDVEHRGLLIDAGTPAMLGRFGWSLIPPTNAAPVEHDGASWTRVADRSLAVSFVTTTSTPVFVGARLMGQAGRTATVALDDEVLGTIRLQRDEIRIAQTNATAMPLDAGWHLLTMRFSGRGRGDADAYADVDWIRIGVPDDNAATYGAPTLKDLIAPSAALAGVPHRAIALRAPGAVACPIRIPPGAHVRAAVGLSGVGEADAEVRFVQDGSKPEVIHQLHLKSDERSGWTDLDVPIASHENTLGELELHATAAPEGTRVLFGDPVVALTKTAPSATPAARAVVVVVLDGVERDELPPWGKTAANLPTLNELAQSGVVFDAYRGSTSVVPAAVASLLTGLPPRGHALTDTGARLPDAQVTMSAIARDASIRTAMFTGVPTTFRAFGFGRAWERFVEYSPNAGDPATAPIDGAAAWVTEVAKSAPDAKLLVVVHARGGHPPWDVTPKELAAIPPADYTGPIDPRRAAQVLARLRQKRAGPALSATDRDRVRALETVALDGQDRALGAFVAALRSAGIWDKALVIVTGDVASGASDPLLFADGAELRERVLSLPLYVRFPGGVRAGEHVASPTEMYDVTRTAIAALGLPAPREMLGRDLAAVAAGQDVAPGPQIATLGTSFSVRSGETVLSGVFDKPPRLCDLALDATCAFDRRDAMPLTTQILFRRFVAFDQATRAPPDRREPATIDPETSAALSVWGETD